MSTTHYLFITEFCLDCCNVELHTKYSTHLFYVCIYVKHTHNTYRLSIHTCTL